MLVREEIRGVREAIEREIPFFGPIAMTIETIILQERLNLVVKLYLNLFGRSLLRPGNPSSETECDENSQWEFHKIKERYTSTEKLPSSYHTKRPSLLYAKNRL